MNLKHLVCFVGLLLAVPATSEAGLVSWLQGCGWYNQYCGCHNCYGSGYRSAGYAPFYSSYGTYSSYYAPSYSYGSYYTPSYNYASYYTPSYSYYSPGYYNSGCSSCGFGGRTSYYGYGLSYGGYGQSCCGTGSCGLGGCYTSNWYAPTCNNCSSCGSCNLGGYCPNNCSSCGNNCLTNYGSYCPTNCGSNCQTDCGTNVVANYGSNCNNPLSQATEKNTGSGVPTQTNKKQSEQKSPDDGFGPRQNEPDFNPNDKDYNPQQTVPQKEGDTRQLEENFVKLEQRITWHARTQRTRLNLQARFTAPRLARKQQEEKLVNWTAPAQTQPVSVTDK